MAKLILISGPPRSGKDELAKHIEPTYPYEGFKFAAPIEKALKGFFCMDDEEFFTLRNRDKDKPWSFVGGKTFRSVMQSFSEEWAKQYGKDILGRIAARRVNEAMDAGITHFVFSDCGFSEELPPVKRLFNPADTVLVKLRREGCTYVNDTRNYPIIEGRFSDCDILNYHNNDSIEHLHAFARLLVDEEML